MSRFFAILYPEGQINVLIPMTDASSNKRVLVIEDEPHIQEILKAKSGESGMEFTFAGNGAEGLVMLREHGPFSSILLDIRMPGSDGMWFLEEKKKDATLPQTPVIIFSNLSAHDFIDRAIAFGVKGYLVKANNSVKQIIQEVRKCADHKACTVDRY